MAYNDFEGLFRAIGTADQILVNGMVGVPVTGDVTFTLAAGGSGVTSVSGTANQITASPGSGAVVLSLPAAINATALTLSSTLTVNSLITFNAALGGTSAVFSGTIASAGISATGPISGTAMTMSSDATIAGTLGVTGITTLSAALNGTSATFSGTVSASTLSITNLTSTTIAVGGAIESGASATIWSSDNITHVNIPLVDFTASGRVGMEIVSSAQYVALVLANEITNGQVFVLSSTYANSTASFDIISNGTANKLISIKESNGFFGINKQQISNVLSQLHVGGTASSLTNYGIITLDDNGGNGLTMGYDSTNNWAWLSARSIIGGARKININGACFVSSTSFGMGVQSPQTIGHVVGSTGSISDYGMFTVDSGSATTGTGGSGLAFGYNSSSSYGWVNARTQGGSNRTFSINGNLFVSANGAAVGVGAGTLVPLTALHVVGTAGVIGSSASIFTVDTGSATTGLGGSGLAMGYDSTSNYGWIYSRTQGGTTKTTCINGSLFVGPQGGSTAIGVGTIAPLTSFQIIGQTGSLGASGMFVVDSGSATTGTGGSGLAFGYDVTNNRGWVNARTQGGSNRPFSINDNFFVNSNGGNAVAAVGTSINTGVTLNVNAPSTNYSSTGSLNLVNGNYQLSAGINTSSNYGFIFSYIQGTGSIPLRINSIQSDDGGNCALAISSLITNFGSGVGVVYIQNRTSPPTTNPVSGGFLYAESGALKYRGSSGSVTTIATA